MAFQLIILYCFISLSLILSFFYLMVLLDRTALKFKPLKKFPEVTFVIPAFNAENCIEKTIRAIFDADYPKNKIKVFVVNDGSTDNTLNILNSLKKEYSLQIFNKTNEGRKAYALNYGIKQVKTPYTVVLDADTIISRGLLKKSIQRFENPIIMAVTSKIIPDSRRTFFERMQFVEYAFTSYARDILHAANSVQTTPAYAAFRTEFFRKYGLFDADNITEDVEMGLRIQKYHYDIGYVFDSFAETAVPTRLKDILRQRVRWGYGVFYNLFKYRRLFHPEYGDFGIFFLPSMFLGILVILGAFILAGYNIVSSSINLIHHLSLGWLPVFETNFFDVIVSVSQLKVMLSIFIFLFALLLFFIVKQNTKEITLWDYVQYMLIYNWFLAYFYIVVIIKFISGSKLKW